MRIGGYFSKPKDVCKQKVLGNMIVVYFFVQTFRSINGLHLQGK